MTGRWGRGPRLAAAAAVAAFVALLLPPPPDVLAQTPPPTPPADASVGPYVGYVSYVGTSPPGVDASPYLRPGPAILPPASAGGTVVAVDAPAEGGAPGGNGGTGDVVTRWDVVGLSAMTLGAVGAVGILMGRRRSF